MLLIQDLNVTLSRHTILSNINFSLNDKGLMIGIMGPNGAGKSTLLKAILNLLPHSGKVLYNDKSILPYAAYVPQKATIDLDFPMTVEKVILSGSYQRGTWFKRPDKKAMNKVNYLMEELKLSHLKDRLLNSLSGGQLQRVLLARSLMVEKDIYFLDEPFVGIDFLSTEIITHHLEQLKERGKIIFIVHHDLKSAASLFDEIILLNKTIIHTGKASDMLRPEMIQEAFFNEVIA